MSSDAQDLKLFEKQKRIYPKRVKGRYRNLKWIAMIVCLSIYYLVPFIRWDRGPNAPDQAILIDLVRGRAYWFWFEIWPQEVYILTGILICAAVGLFFVTSLFGRVWCGYLCFQTVWTDLFVWVERIIQGDRTKRKKLREGPWTFEKFYKLAITHFIWLVIAWCTAGSFVLYFNDAPTLVHSFLMLDVSPVVLGFVGGLTFMTYMMAGFAREQVCTFMCPYARFQSAMFDKDTLIISYDVDRGEPRGKHKKGADWTDLGDCIDCTACVQVCPTGIDIREGLQMECIACGLCADACDEIMDKVGLERGLIGYNTEARMDAARQGRSEPFHIWRPRTFYYASVLCLIGGLMLHTLLTRSPLEIAVLHDRNPLFVQLSDGDIRNAYSMKVLNKTHEHRHYKLSVDGLDHSDIQIKTAGQTTKEDIYVEADSVKQYRLLVRSSLPKQEPREIKFKLTDIETGYEASNTTMFISQHP